MQDQHGSFPLEDQAYEDQDDGDLGFTVDRDDDNQYVVISMAAGGAAQKSNEVFVGDVLLSVDGVVTRGRSAEQVLALLQGPVGSRATLALSRNPKLDDDLGKVHMVFLAREQESAPQSSMQPGEPWYPHQSANQRARIPTEIFVDSKPLSAPRRMEGNVDGIEGRNNLGDERAQAMSWDETAQAQAMSWEAKTQNGLRLRGGLIVSDKSPYTVILTDEFEDEISKAVTRDAGLNLPEVKVGDVLLAINGNWLMEGDLPSQMEDHPEWLAPVPVASTDDTITFTLRRAATGVLFTVECVDSSAHSSLSGTKATHASAPAHGSESHVSHHILSRLHTGAPVDVPKVDIPHAHAPLLPAANTHIPHAHAPTNPARRVEEPSQSREEAIRRAEEPNRIRAEPMRRVEELYRSREEDHVRRVEESNRSREETLREVPTRKVEDSQRVAHAPPPPFHAEPSAPSTLLQVLKHSPDPPSPDANPSQLYYSRAPIAPQPPAPAPAPPLASSHHTSAPAVPSTEEEQGRGVTRVESLEEGSGEGWRGRLRSLGRVSTSAPPPASPADLQQPSIGGARESGSNGASQRKTEHVPHPHAPTLPLALSPSLPPSLPVHEAAEPKSLPPAPAQSPLQAHHPGGVNGVRSEGDAHVMGGGGPERANGEHAGGNKRKKEKVPGREGVGYKFGGWKGDLQAAVKEGRVGGEPAGLTAQQVDMLAVAKQRLVSENPLQSALAPMTESRALPEKETERGAEEAARSEQEGGRREEREGRKGLVLWIPSLSEAGVARKDLPDAPAPMTFTPSAYQRRAQHQHLRTSIAPSHAPSSAAHHPPPASPSSGHYPSHTITRAPAPGGGDYPSASAHIFPPASPSSQCYPPPSPSSSHLYAPSSPSSHFYQPSSSSVHIPAPSSARQPPSSPVDQFPSSPAQPLPESIQLSPPDSPLGRHTSTPSSPSIHSMPSLPSTPVGAAKFAHTLVLPKALPPNPPSANQSAPPLGRTPPLDLSRAMATAAPTFPSHGFPPPPDSSPRIGSARHGQTQPGASLRVLGEERAMSGQEEAALKDLQSRPEQRALSSIGDTLESLLFVRSPRRAAATQTAAPSSRNGTSEVGGEHVQQRMASTPDDRGQAARQWAENASEQRPGGGRGMSAEASRRARESVSNWMQL